MVLRMLKCTLGEKVYSIPYVTGRALREMDAANAIYPMSLTGEEQAEVLQTITQNAQLGLMKLIQQLPAELLVMLNGGAAK